MKNFALLGLGGYVAPRHLKAIKETGNRLIASCDTRDSVGIIDSFFPEASFFTEMELFDRHCSKIIQLGQALDYLSICTPNYLHDAHIRYGLRLGLDVICEKPLVLNPWNIDALRKIEDESRGRVYNILQLRLHKAIRKMKEQVDRSDPSKVHEVDLTYITSRGNWYYASWKGEDRKSGGIATNIGIHFYDMLGWVFGKMTRNVVHAASHDRVAGYLELEKARIRYFLSINPEHLPEAVKRQGLRTYRSMVLGEEEIEFSGGFNDLHTESYKEILAGRGFGLEESRPAVEMVHAIRNATPIGLKGDYHPMARFPLCRHPFYKG